MKNLTSSVILALLVLNSFLFAQEAVSDSVATPVVEQTVAAPIADSTVASVAEPAAAEESVVVSAVDSTAVPAVDSVVAPAAETSAQPAVEPAAEQVAAEQTVAEPVAEQTVVEQPAVAPVTNSTAPQKPALTDEQIAKLLMQGKPKFPRHLVQGFVLQGGYSNNGGIDVSLGFMFPLLQSWPVSIGFDLLRTQIGGDDFPTVSDETLLTMGVGIVVGVLATATGFSAKESPKDSKEEKASTAKNSMSTATAVLSLALMIPMYAWCGTLYVPVVPGAWLGVVDKSRMLTQVISEGFHKRSFTYQNDVGLRLSPLASQDGMLHAFVDGGIRFSKNFDDDLKRYYFAHAGVALSF